MCRDGIRKAKTLTELNFVRDTKNNKKGFYRYIGLKRKTRKSVEPLTNEDLHLQQVTTVVEKAEVLNFFALLFMASQVAHIS